MGVNFLHTEQMQTYRRGDLWLADLTGVTGSEQGGIRPALILSNDIGNRFSPIVTVAIVSSQIGKKRLPTHVFLDAERYNLERDSFVLTEQLKTIDKWNLMRKLTSLDRLAMDEIDKALIVSLDIQLCAV